jgi:serine/threonine-protein kinase RsbW
MSDNTSPNGSSRDGLWSWSVDTTLASRRGGHLDCMREILSRLTDLGWEGRDVFAIEMTLEETLSNAIKHGNKFDESKQVFVQCRISPERFWLRVRDEGEGFVPEEVPDCRSKENLEKCGGRGVMLIKAFMDQVTFNEAGNCVTLEKTRR